MASLKSAWDEISHQTEYAGITVTYFANTRQSMKDLQVCKGMLVPKTERLKKGISFTSNGITEISPEKYDVFFVYGGRFKLQVADLQPFSTAVVNSWLQDLVRNSSSLDICRKLREITDKPIFVGHDPLLAMNAEDLLKIDSTEYKDVLELFQSKIYDSLKCTILKQPEETIYKGQFTKKDYSSGSVSLTISHDRVDRPHSLNDVWHMNAEFGKAYWSANMARLCNSL